MKRTTRMTAPLTSNAATQPGPGWTFDPDRMIRIADCHSIIEVLRHIKHSGPEWVHRNVHICFPGPSNAWALVYPLQNASAPYFDFMYTHKEPPQEALSALGFNLVRLHHHDSTWVSPNIFGTAFCTFVRIFFNGKRPARPPFARTPRPASCAFSSRGFIWKRCTRGARPGLSTSRPGGAAG